LFRTVIVALDAMPVTPHRRRTLWPAFFFGPSNTDSF